MRKPLPEVLNKELLYYWLAMSVEVRVPKRRGKGFLKVPYGHHVNDKLNRIADEVGCDVSGLDGTLSFEVGMKVVCCPERREKLISKLMPMLADHYGFPFRMATHSEGVAGAS